MVKPFNIDITARDKTGEAVAQVNKNFQKLASGTGLEATVKRMGVFHEKLGALSGITSGLGRLNDAGRLSAGGLSEAGSALKGLGAGAGLAEAAAGGVVVALGAATIAAAKFEITNAASGAAISRMSQQLGISSDQLQRYQIAGQLAGVSAEDMTTAIHNAGTTMQDAVSGRNQSALALMNRLGITLHRNAEGGVDQARALDDVAAAMARSNPQTRELIANQFGVASAIQFLMQTEAQRQAELAAADRSGMIRNQQQLAQEREMSAKVTELDQKWKGLINTMTTKFVIPWLEPVIDELNGMASGRPTKADTALGDKLVAWGFATKNKTPAVGGGMPTGTAAVNPIAVSVRDYFEKQGWSRNQAAGIAANLEAESNFGSHRTGDSGLAYGLGQWHPDRQADFAARFGHPIQQSTAAEQLAFVQYELTQGSRRGAGQLLRGATTAGQAGDIVSRFYESPRDVAGQAMARASLAENIVHVEITAKGLPAGTVVATRSSTPKVSVNAAITPSLAGASI